MWLITKNLKHSQLEEHSILLKTDFLKRVICSSFSSDYHNIIQIYNNIMWNIPTFSLNVGLFHIILSIPQNIVTNMNNVMTLYTVYGV